MQEPMLENDNRPAELPAQLIPRPVPRDRSKESCGGYDCEFMEPSPSVLQTEYPICLHLRTKVLLRVY